MKIGSYVNVLKHDGTYVLKGGLLTHINGNIEDVEGIVSLTLDDETNYRFNDYKIELWTPKKGDLCWFWSEGMIIPVFDALDWIKDNSKGLNKLKYVINNSNCIAICCYEFCAPFKGDLPIILKGVYNENEY